MDSKIFPIVFFLCFISILSAETSKPNIVFILADDLGYGDIKALNPGCKNAAPAIDRICDEGMVFTDMHAGASWCTPSRYALMTATYPHKADLSWTKRPVITKDELTLPAMLKRNGYATCMIGKWHLGFETGMDFNADKLPGGPVDRGFDEFYGLPHSLDIQPYLYIVNDKPEKKPTVDVKAKGPSDPNLTNIQGEFWRKGKMSEGFDHSTVLDIIADKSVEKIHSHAKNNKKPLFLYIPLTAPHTPWLPGERFLKNSPNEMYGAFVAHVDDCINKIDKALKDSGLAENTILVITSDNGPVWYDKDISRTGHKSTGIMRGMKGDAWEGGHRVPFVLRWPGKVKSGSRTAEITGFVDMLPTFAEIAGDKDVKEKFIDGYSIKEVLSGGKTKRKFIVHLATKQFVAVRKGNWKYIPFIGSGGFSKPKFVKPKQGEASGQLYNLEKDPSETKNVFSDHPEIVSELKKIMEAELK
ncbi:MAG: arylsulfatase [Lentisphaeraceae bacterium]|nr:arylsulfatase [Lentisphaeraceae bacterium]